MRWVKVAINHLVMAWWDGIMYFASALSDFSLAQMQSCNRELEEIANEGLSDDAVALAKQLDRQRHELHDTIRACVESLNKLDRVYEEVHAVGRKKQ